MPDDKKNQDKPMASRQDKAKDDKRGKEKDIEHEVGNDNEPMEGEHPDVEADEDEDRITQRNPRMTDEEAKAENEGMARRGQQDKDEPAEND